MNTEPTEPAGDSQGDLTPQTTERAKREGVNIRMARAGLFVLQGLAIGAALRRAGYAETTARKPSHNGLTAERCLAEAAKLDRKADPGAMVSKVRRVLTRTLDGLLDLSDADLAEPKRANTVSKVAEMVERYHGRGIERPPTDGGARSFAERAADLAELLAEMRRRGLVAGHENAGSRDLPAIEAQVVEAPTPEIKEDGRPRE